MTKLLKHSYTQGNWNVYSVVDEVKFDLIIFQKMSQIT